VFTPGTRIEQCRNALADGQFAVFVLLRNTLGPVLRKCEFAALGDSLDVVLPAHGRVRAIIR
jgi:hypothetical protein